MTRRGMTLAECLVALVVSLAILAAVDASLALGQRFTRASKAARGLRQNLHAAAAVLRAELEGVSTAAGDLLAISDSAVVLRVPRVFGVVCGLSPPGVLVLDDSLLSQLRAADPARDSALVFREGDSLTATDDRWVNGPVTQVRRGRCAGGSPGTVIGVGAPAPGMAGVGMGAPVRIFEIAEYRRYRDASGLWWLGVRNPAGSGWAATSPIAGPLAPSGGLVFAWRNAALAPTLDPDSVAYVDVILRMLDQRRFAPGRAVTAESLIVGIALGS